MTSNWEALFHQVWTKAVGTPEYRKEDWLSLQRILNDLQRAAGRRIAVIQDHGEQ